MTVLRYKMMIDYGQTHLYDELILDYFALSLPDFPAFEDDLSQRNQKHCYYLIALGHRGLGQDENAQKYFNHWTLTPTI